MDVSLQSIIFFTIITVVYFAMPSLGKPLLTLNDLTPEGVTPEFYKKTTYSLLFYLGAVLVSQLFLNIIYLISKCGGSLDKNIGAAALFTFVPWIFIFGALLATLVIFPSLKNAFSDVIGYYVVAGSANDLFSSMFIGSDLTEKINQTSDAQAKMELTKAAEAIVKIVGNKSILINQMTTDNFLSVWERLKPLMNEGYYDNVEVKQQLLNLVVLKDNIGEALWYIYAAILISSIVYYNLATRGCVKSVDQIKADRDKYIEQQEELDKQKEATQTTYTL